MSPKQLIRLFSFFFILFFYSMEIQSQSLITGVIIEERIIFARGR